MTATRQSTTRGNAGVHPVRSKPARIERGRSRKTAATLALAPSVFTYTDIDGDKVKITASTGNLAGHATIVGGQLRLLDLSDPMFNGTSITFTVTKAGNGDGLAAVGRINGGSNDFGTIVVRGDLGAITAGSGSATVPAIQSLRVHSMGIYGLATQGGAGDLGADLNGALGMLTVAGDVKEAIVYVAGKVGPVTIGGSLIGGDANLSGSIVGRDGLGLVKIAGSVTGGSGIASGAVMCVQDIAGVTIGGSLIGGPGFTSSVIYSALGPTGAVKIGGDIVGGTAPLSGRVYGRTKLASVTVGGSLIGGSAHDSGQILSDGDIGPVSVGRDVRGGTDHRCGYIDSAGKIGAIHIGGSLIGGSGGTCGSIFSLGETGPITIAHDMRGGTNFADGQIFSGAKLLAITIGGSLIGGAGDVSGMIFGAGIGAVKIAGNVLGGTGPGSALIECPGKLASVTIGGSLLAGPGSNSARIVSDDDMGPVNIAGDMQGEAIFSGFIECRGKLASVTIGGSLRGGSGRNSGVIFSKNDMGPVKIGLDLVGGSVSGSSPQLDRSGFIETEAGRIVSVTIGGSVRAGIDNTTFGGHLLRNAAIAAGNDFTGHDIGAITVGDSVVGSVGVTGNITRVAFTARGQAAPTATKDVAIGKLTIGGRAERMSVLAGYASNLNTINGNAQIGTISIGGNLVASNLIAGVRDFNGDGFGNADDIIIGNLPNSIAKIAGTAVGGVVIGTPASGDRFAIESHRIGSLTINGFTVPVAGSVSLSPLTGDDVTAREL
jgi:hypothetical protein